MNNLDFSNHGDVIRVRSAVNSARSAARNRTYDSDKCTSYDIQNFHELDALAFEMDAKVLEASHRNAVLSKDATPVQIARLAENKASIALARAHRDEADEAYQEAHEAWMAE
jgi:hypothetical protein